MADRLAARLHERVLSAQRGLQIEPHDTAQPGPWGVDDFLQGGHIHVGDIILYARSGNVLSAFVKWATSCDFSHAGMVYYTPKQDQGFDHHFMIEADQNGVDLSPLKPYMNDPAVTIAILRLPARKAWLDKDICQDMRGRLMETIADTYDFSTIERLAREALKTSLFGIESMVRGAHSTISDMRRRKPSSLPHAFICSGLVQVGYTFACLQAIKRGDVRPEVIRDTIFRNDLLEWFEPQWNHYTAEGRIDQAEELYRSFLGDLEATTPADIAGSENLQWCYLNTGGVVWRVDSATQARDLMCQTPRQSGRTI